MIDVVVVVVDGSKEQGEIVLKLVLSVCQCICDLLSIYSGFIDKCFFPIIHIFISWLSYMIPRQGMGGGQGLEATGTPSGSERFLMRDLPVDFLVVYITPCAWLAS